MAPLTWRDPGGAVHSGRQSNAYDWWKVACTGKSVHVSRLRDDQATTCLWCAAGVGGVDLDNFAGFAP